jgi:hypothetical protein
MPVRKIPPAVMPSAKQIKIFSFSHPDSFYGNIINIYLTYGFVKKTCIEKSAYAEEGLLFDQHEALTARLPRQSAVALRAMAGLAERQILRFF